MPWQNAPAFPLDEAVANGQDVYEVIVTEWGLKEAGAPAPSAFINTLWPPPVGNVVQPGLGVTLAGIAIGPRSTVDRCLVTYNLQGPKAVVVPQQDRVRRLSVDSPLYFVQAANAGARADVALNPRDNQTTKQALYVWSGQTVLAEPNAFNINNVDGIFVDKTVQFVGIDGAPHQLFLPGFSANSAFQEKPMLHLLLYTKPFLQMPASRAPMVRQGSRTITIGGQVVLGKLPVFGRKHISVRLFSDVAATFKVTSLRALTDNAPDNIEFLEVNTGVVPPLTAVDYRLDHIGADYLVIYVDPAGPGAARWSMIAEDK